MERLKLKGRQTNRNTQDFGNRNNFRRKNNTPQIIQRDRRNKEYQKVQTPLQNNLVDDEEDQEIHCLGDTTTSLHLTRSNYEEYLMSNQLNQLSKGEKVNETQNKYNLRSTNKEGKPSTSTQPKKSDTM
jgi:hypothetical protein